MRAPGRQEGSGRYLTTVLFADIASSTELAASIGDAAWQNLLHRYYALVRERLRRYRGREIDTAGDGFFAAFDAPGNAIGCAIAIRDGAAAIGLADSRRLTPPKGAAKMPPPLVLTKCKETLLARAAIHAQSPIRPRCPELRSATAAIP